MVFLSSLSRYNHHCFITPAWNNFINESIHSALMNWDFFWAPTGVAHFESFDESTQSHYFTLTPMPIPIPHPPPPPPALHFTLCLNPACLFCDGKAAFLYGKQAVWVYHIHITLRRAPHSTCTSSLHWAPHWTLSKEIHTRSGLMHFIKVATCGGQEYISLW